MYIFFYYKINQSIKNIHSKVIQIIYDRLSLN